MAAENRALKKISLQIGDYEVHAIPTGLFGLDGGAMFGTVPKVLWQKTNPADEQNRISLEARALLLKSSKRNILIDNGIGHDFVEKYGDKLGKKFADIYAVKSGVASLEKSLAFHGLKLDEITDVILTHLHFDHAGGSTRSENGKLVPTFPKAKYYVQKKNLDVALKPNLREKASYLPANFQPLLQQNVLETLSGPSENYFPNISFYISDGHTQGMQVVKVSDGKNGIVYCADLIPTSTHVRLPFVMGYDLEPLRLIEEKRKLLQEVEQKNWYLFFEHDPHMDAARVSQLEGDFSVSEGYVLQ